MQTFKELYKCLLLFKELYKFCYCLRRYVNVCDVEPSVRPSAEAGDTGTNMAAVFALDVAQAGKEACAQKEPRHSGSGPTSDTVCTTPVEKVGHSAEIKVGDGKGDGQESVGEFGKLNIELSENGNGLYKNSWFIKSLTLTNHSI